MSNNTRYPFIVVEGPNSVGKTTLIRGLAERYLKAGKPVTPLRNPGSTSLGMKIREALVEGDEMAAPDTQMLAFTAATTELVAKRIIPELEEGIVIVDRYLLSTCIYQGMLAEGPLAPFITRFAEVTKYLPEPDLTIILWADGGVLWERAQERSGGLSDKVGADMEGSIQVKKDLFEEGGARRAMEESAAWLYAGKFLKGSYINMDTSKLLYEEVLDKVWEGLVSLGLATAEPKQEEDKDPLHRAKQALSEYGDN